MYIVNNYIIAQFQVGYMLYKLLNQNKAFKDQVEIIMSSILGGNASHKNIDEEI